MNLHKIVTMKIFLKMRGTLHIEEGTTQFQTEQTYDASLVEVDNRPGQLFGLLDGDDIRNLNAMSVYNVRPQTSCLLSWICGYYANERLLDEQWKTDSAIQDKYEFKINVSFGDGAGKVAHTQYKIKPIILRGKVPGYGIIFATQDPQVHYAGYGIEHYVDQPKYSKIYATGAREAMLGRCRAMASIIFTPENNDKLVNGKQEEISLLVDGVPEAIARKLQ